MPIITVGAVHGLVRDPDGDCKWCEQLIVERDDAQEWADKLADRIATILDVEIGEHSNRNNPWREACDYADGFVAQRLKTKG